MSSWYSKDLGDGVEAYAPTLKIQEIFEAFFAASGLPKDMALFSNYDLGRNVVTVYVSPRAKSLALAINAEPCEKPSREGLSLLLGHADAWSVLFPD
jgi:hypothetical protein